jgi:L-threonylcarbamoyladenylate synthase
LLRITASPVLPDPAAIAEAAAVLRAGGVIAFATDTTYGLAADPRSDAAVERVFAAKGRPHALAMPLVAADLAQAREAGTFDEMALRLAADFWPGPLSIVVPAASAVSRRALGGRDTVAIRVPRHPVAQALAAAFGCALTATSANPSGAPPAETADEVAATLGRTIDAVIDSGPAPGGPPSTIVAVERGVPVCVRAGAVPWERVLRSLE